MTLTANSQVIATAEEACQADEGTPKSDGKTDGNRVRHTALQDDQPGHRKRAERGERAWEAS